ncbi:hypothetical protein RN001_012084 [Aquatica leii]|uniref:CHK kinase-like domain-containing protein n=1 Tax=Aquatica leii TaxID=1421715 RepID=A0AAN7PTW4_9COLE|nr:hypothetical protein RN001_012084 [Aquatica leii]
MSQSNNFITNHVHLCLENLVNKLHIRNYTIVLSAGSEIGSNFSGVIAKATIKGEDENGKKMVRSFIIKSAPRDEAYRTVGLINNVFNREIYIYKKVLHEFDLLQKEKNVKNPFKSYPKYYESSMNDMNEAVIMENVKDYGFVTHNRQKPLNYDHTLFVLREYGKFHALSFAMRLHKPQLLKEMAENTQENFFTTDQCAEMHNVFVQQSKRVLSAIDPIKEKILYERFKQFQNNMVDTVKSALISDLSNPHFIITHGDCWTNNFLFKYDNSMNRHSPISVCILDWQIAHYGSPAHDLSYFMFTSTDKSLRDHHYSSLMDEYYKSFSDFLKELGGDPEKQFPFKTFQEHLKKYSVFGLYMTIECLFIMTSDVEEIPNMHSISQNDELSKQMKYDSKNVEAYNSRMKDIILDFVRLGYDF